MESVDLNEELEINRANEMVLYDKQKNFLETDIGKAVNTAIDIALKSVLPNLIENEVIDVKNSILEQGFSEGIKSAINSSIDMGKSLSGIVTGDFENISQVQMAVKKGGMLDKISAVLDFSINLANKKNLIDNNISNMLKQGKNSIIGAIGNKIEETLTEQLKSIEKLEKYCNSWNIAYNNKDFNNMEKSYKNITKYLSKIVPLENIINESRKIENLHNLIKNNGNDFNITIEQELLAQKLR